jgi:uncharacterized repeat protein (TIGR03803 family)
MSRIRSRQLFLTLCSFLVVLSTVASRAQTFTTLVNFDGTDGQGPMYVMLLQGFDGNFYGTTAGGGTNVNCPGGCGTIFKMASSGEVTTLHSFNGTDGWAPEAGVIQTASGDFYGTTYSGDAQELGNIFKTTPAGATTSLFNFSGADGQYPEAALIQGTDGNFYGTTYGGGSHLSGTVFKITPQGKLTTLYNFCSEKDCPDGSGPVGPLFQASDGDFYGTTLYGGENDTYPCNEGCGTLFKITSQGKLTRLYSFCSEPNCADGSSPTSGLMQAADGTLYGTANGGGANDLGTVFKLVGYKPTIIYSFCSLPNCADGIGPNGTLIQATDGNFYGTTEYGGVSEFCHIASCGTIFQLTPAGVLTTLYDFGFDGVEPEAGLTQGTDGSFYGTTTNGSYGTVFNLSMGLGPFVEAIPASGEIGAQVTILGNNLKGTISVSFDGASATFKVVSNSEITATVPAGATTGTVEVTTPSGVLDSNLAFRVTN